VWTLGRPGANTSTTPGSCSTRSRGGAAGAGAAVVGTPDDLVATIRTLQEVTGGFGVVVGFAHDWANREATFRSWELLARYVVPEVNGYTRRLRESMEYLNTNQAELMAGAGRR
jgi:limonene 1,2-monooxygenase